MKTKLSIAVGSILGAVVVHLALTACGGKTTNANAQTTPTCSAWTTGFYLYDVQVPTGNLPLDQLVATSAMPAGWEPIATSPAFGSTDVTVMVTLRKCTSSQ